MLGAAQHTVGAGEGPDGAPTDASAYPYGGTLVGVQWRSTDLTASTQVALTGGAEPTSAGQIVDTVAAGGENYETGTTTNGFWWVRHAKNGQFSAWVVAPFAGSGGGDGGGDPEGGEELHPEITSVTQTTNPANCQVGSPVNLRIQFAFTGTSLMTLQRRTNGGAGTTIDSGVTGSPVNVSVTSGSNYGFRMKYNDVSPETWSGWSADVSASCELI
jgi:hypothetical protein